MADDPELRLPTVTVTAPRTSRTGSVNSTRVNNTLHEFRNTVRKNGLFKESRFIVRILPPRSMSNSPYYDPSKRKSVDLFARSISFPGKQMSTTDTQFGAHRQVAYKPIVQQADASFILSRDLRERAFFEDWQNSMVNPVSFNSISYYKDYIGEIHILTLSDRIELGGLLEARSLGDITSVLKDQTVTSKTILRDAWPITIGELPLSADSVDTFAHLSINFFFRKYETEYYGSDNRLSDIKLPF